jgi:inner membrane protease subunit 1
MTGLAWLTTAARRIGSQPLSRKSLIICLKYIRPRIIPTSIRIIQFYATYHLLTTHVFTIQGCLGASMLPTLAYSGDWVLVSPLPYRRPFQPFIPPKRGDIVVAEKPTNQEIIVCKRVIGLPGDLVEVEVRRDVGMGRKKGQGQWVRVPKGSVWLAGDNLCASTDSRDYGPVPLAMVKGKVLARVSYVGKDGACS